MTPSDIIFLLGSHLIVCDGEINEMEYKLLNGICCPSESSFKEQEKIFSDSPSKKTEEELLEEYSNQSDNYDLLLDTLYRIEYADGYASPQEEEWIHNIAGRLKYGDDKLTRIKSKYLLKEDDANENIKINWAESLTSAFKSLIFFLNAKESEDGDSSELLSGSIFAKKVKDLASVSKQDLERTESIMLKYCEEISSGIENIKKNITNLECSNRTEKEVQSLVANLVKTNQWLSDDVSRSLKDNMCVLDKKKRTINYFTIAFMGRTKAGKSTFHKVVTHDVNDDIGVGKLRTTRYNRSFYWENIRILDTPGIGAPGGKSDTEVAMSIIDEADLICYIVTNDSIQETEFDFLNSLKERSKPLFIILNIKSNLDQPIRLKRFLADPLAWKKSNGPDGIQGHLNRIRDAMGNKWDMNMVDIIPIHLYSAILRNQDGRFSDEEKDRLLEGSNIQEYVAKVKSSIFKYGSLRKTQNIFDGCAYQIHKVYYGLNSKRESVLEDINLLDKAFSSLNTFINNEQSNVENKIKDAVRSEFDALRSNARRFANINYEGENLDKKWGNDIDNKRIYDRLSKNIERIYEDFNNAISDRVKECLGDLQLSQREFYKTKDRISGETIHDWKFGANIISTVINVATPIIIGNIWNPGGWILTGITVGIGIIGYLFQSLFQSKKQKISEAQDKVFKGILKSLNESENAVLSECLKSIKDNVEQVKVQLDNSLGIVLTESRKITDVLDSLIEISGNYEKDMVDMLIYRVLQYLEPLKYQGNELPGLTDIKKIVSGERLYDRAALIISKPTNIPRELLELASNITQMRITNM